MPAAEMSHSDCEDQPIDSVGVDLPHGASFDVYEEGDGEVIEDVGGGGGKDTHRQSLIRGNAQRRAYEDGLFQRLWARVRHSPLAIRVFGAPSPYSSRRYGSRFDGDGGEGGQLSERPLTEPERRGAQAGFFIIGIIFFVIVVVLVMIIGFWN